MLSKSATCDPFLRDSFPFRIENCNRIVVSKFSARFIFTKLSIIGSGIVGIISN